MASFSKIIRRAFDRAKSKSTRGSIGDHHPFRKFEMYIFVADAFTYDNRRYLEDKFCFSG